MSVLGLEHQQGANHLQVPIAGVPVTFRLGAHAFLYILSHTPVTHHAMPRKHINHTKIIAITKAAAFFFFIENRFPRILENS